MDTPARNSEVVWLVTQPARSRELTEGFLKPVSSRPGAQIICSTLVALLSRILRKCRRVQYGFSFSDGRDIIR